MRLYPFLTAMLTSLLALTLLLGVHAAPAKNPAPLANAVILIIRHAEKPNEGSGLTPTGQKRALAYVHYFQTYQVDGKPLRLDHLIVSADTPHSQRPRLTLLPLSQAANLPLDNQFADKDVAALAAMLQTRPRGKAILICWHHKEIPEILQALGAGPAILPNDKWPDSVFNQVIQLRYDSNGHLSPGAIRLINEHLLPGDNQAP